MIIAHISDTHIDPDHIDCIKRLEDVKRVVATINALDPLPNVVIHTGDIAHNGTVEKYAVSLNILKELRMPLLAAAGNRDDRGLIRANFLGGKNLLPGASFVQYDSDDFPIHLIALDTLSESSNMGDYCLARADSLRAALIENKNKRSALFMHHPPFEVTNSKYRSQFDSLSAIDFMANALKGQDHVEAIFCGHAHRETRGSLAGIPAVGVPSVAVDLRLGDLPAAAASVPVFYLHRFGPVSGFKTELIIAS